jgi:uncharacterized protein
VQPDAVSGQSRSAGRLVFKGEDGRPEVGLWRCTPGRWRLSIPANELCFFAKGLATYRSDEGEMIEAVPDSVIHFKTGFTGEATVHEPITVTYMLTDGGPGTPTPVLRAAHSVPAAKDWGVIPTMIEGESRTAGILLSRDPDMRAESGIWICTPGIWRCEVVSAEYCHFLSGRSTYVHESGETIEIHPDTLAFFPKGWKGTCRVHETIRKVYMIQ